MCEHASKRRAYDGTYDIVVDSVGVARLGFVHTVVLNLVNPEGVVLLERPGRDVFDKFLVTRWLAPGLYSA